MSRNKRNLYPGIFVAFALMFFSFFSMSFPEWLISRDWGEIGQPSALQLTLEPIYFGGVMLMFPFAACSVFAPQQVEEIQSGFVWERCIRISISRYGFEQLLRNFILCILCFSSAFLVHALLFHLIALPSDPELYDAHDIPYAPDCIYADWLSVFHGLPIILWSAIMVGLTSGVWGTLGLAVSAWIPDRLLTISVPTFIYYVFSAQSFLRLTGGILPHPADLYNDALTLEMIRRSFVYNVLLLLIFSAIYLLGIRRRVRK